MAEARLGWVEQLGKRTLGLIAEVGYLSALLVESLYWLVAGSFKRQPVRVSAVFSEMMRTGVSAIPIVFLLSFSIGIMLAIQGIHTLRTFGAESQVVIGIALSITREFGPLITGIVVAGRTGSALAARIGTMVVSEEIDALRVMGIQPVRYLVSPVLLAMLVMLPALTVMADFAGLLGGAVYSAMDLGISYAAYADRVISVLKTGDIFQGLSKSCVFATVITLIGVANGFTVTGGAEGVGRATTRSVVLAISGIVIADMVFTWFLNR